MKIKIEPRHRFSSTGLHSPPELKHDTENFITPDSDSDFVDQDYEGLSPRRNVCTLSPSDSVMDDIPKKSSSVWEHPELFTVYTADGKKKFQCRGFGPCDMEFTRAEHLARHIRKHTGERPYRCSCRQYFSRLDNLRQHWSSAHPNLDLRYETTISGVRTGIDLAPFQKEPCPDEDDYLSSIGIDPKYKSKNMTKTRSKTGRSESFRFNPTSYRSSPAGSSVFSSTPHRVAASRPAPLKIKPEISNFHSSVFHSANQQDMHRPTSNSSDHGEQGYNGGWIYARPQANTWQRRPSVAYSNGMQTPISTEHAAQRDQYKKAFAQNGYWNPYYNWSPAEYYPQNARSRSSLPIMHRPRSPRTWQTNNGQQAVRDSTLPPLRNCKNDQNSDSLKALADLSSRVEDRNLAHSHEQMQPPSERRVSCPSVVDMTKPRDDFEQYKSPRPDSHHQSISPESSSRVLYPQSLHGQNAKRMSINNLVV